MIKTTKTTFGANDSFKNKKNIKKQKTFPERASSHYKI
jgi:hypothetical protein